MDLSLTGPIARKLYHFSTGIVIRNLQPLSALILSQRAPLPSGGSYSTSIAMVHAKHTHINVSISYLNLLYNVRIYILNLGYLSLSLSLILSLFHPRKQEVWTKV